MASPPLGILVVPGAAHAAIVDLLRRDCRELGVQARILCADPDPEWSACARLADLSLPIGPPGEPGFADELAGICRDHDVRLVIPLSDEVLPALAAIRDELARHGVLAAVSSPQAVRTARDKALTAAALRAAGLDAPATVLGADFVHDPDMGPVVVKPRIGSGSEGVRVVASRRDFEAALEAEGDCVVQPLLIGPEYTVNFFVDPDGRCRAAVPHLRHEVRAGKVSKASTARIAALIDAAAGVAAAIPGAFGPWCYQAILTDEGPVIFEVNARLSAGYAIADRAGARFTRWLIELALGRTPAFHNDWTDEVWMIWFDQMLSGVGGLP